MNALPVDITNITNQNDFLLLVEEMNRTHIPRALKRENKTVALLLPAEKTEYAHKKSDERVTLPPLTTTLAAGYQSIPALPSPLSWKDLRRIAQEDHVEELMHKDSLPYGIH
jgi:hypothetical protein